MDELWKGLLTAVSVVLVLAWCRRWGGSTAGMVAGLPTTTAPALGWLAHEHGTAFAVDAAAATVGACALTAAFALAYAHASVRLRSRGAALACGALAAGLTVIPVLTVGDRLLPALAFALLGGVWALRAWPGRPQAERCTESPVVSSPLMPGAVAGGVSLGLAALAPLVGSVVAGVLAALPIVSVTVAAAEHAAGGPAAARRFLFGALVGVFGRVAFGAAFAAAAAPWGAGWALGLAAVATGAVNLALAPWWRPGGCSEAQRRGTRLQALVHRARAHDAHAFQQVLRTVAACLHAGRASPYRAATGHEIGDERMQWVQWRHMGQPGAAAPHQVDGRAGEKGVDPHARGEGTAGDGEGHR